MTSCQVQHQLCLEKSTSGSFQELFIEIPREHAPLLAPQHIHPSPRLFPAPSTLSQGGPRVQPGRAAGEAGAPRAGPQGATGWRHERFDGERRFAHPHTTPAAQLCASTGRHKRSECHLCTLRGTAPSRERAETDPPGETSSRSRRRGRKLAAAATGCFMVPVKEERQHQVQHLTDTTLSPEIRLRAQPCPSCATGEPSGHQSSVLNIL